MSCFSRGIPCNTIKESSELEATLKGHLVPLPCSEQGHLQLHQIAQTPIQPDLECLQGWGFHHLSGQCVSMPHHSHCRRLFPYIQPKFTLFRSETISPCPITSDSAKESDCALLSCCSPSGTDRPLSALPAALPSPCCTAPALSVCPCR